MAKKKIQKKKKPEVQDFITKVKELRKMNELIAVEESGDLIGNGCPAQFAWQGQVFKIQKLIGKWTILESEDENENKEYLRNCYRVELENGYQVDIAHEVHQSQWLLFGMEPELFEKLRQSTNSDSA